MITLTTSGDSVVFNFDNNGHYLQEGTIEVPKNSLSLVIDMSDMVTFKKAASNDVFVSATLAELGMTKEQLIAFYEENMVGGNGLPTEEIQEMIDESVSGYADSVLYNSTSKYVEFYHGGSGGTKVYEFDASDFVIDGMIDDVRIETISGVSYLVIDFNTASGKEDIQIPLTDIFNPSDYYTTAQTDTKIAEATSGKVDNDTYTAYTAATDATLSGKQDSSKLPPYIVNDVDFRENKVIIGETIKSNGSNILQTNNVITINNQAIFNNSNLSNLSLVETSAVTSAVTSASTDSEVPSAKAVYDVLSGKADTSYVDQSVSGKQDTLSAGTNITITDNVISADVDVKAIEGGRGISITTGESADTVAFNLPIYQGKGNSSLSLTQPSGTTQYGNKVSGFSTTAIGAGLNVNNQYETALGVHNVDSVDVSGIFGQSGVTLFSIGNGAGPNARHNAIEIKQNGDLYIADTNNTTYTDFNTKPMVKLQDVLDGKQDTLSAGTNITISGNVISAEGGGKAIEGGRGITVTTGETADTVSFNLPISAGTGSDSIVEGSASNKATSKQAHAEGFSTSATSQGAHSEGMYSKATQSAAHAEGNNTKANGYYSHAEGNNTNATGQESHAEGFSTSANGFNSHAEGYYTNATNVSEHASGRYNVSNKANDTWGNSGNTLFSVGNGTAANARHNAFEIRQNGDIYISSGGTDIKLQDNLGSTIEISSAITSGDTNPVQGGAIYDKFDEVEQVTARALNSLSEADEVTARALIDLNEKFDGLKLKKVTQAQYDAMVSGGTIDNQTLYVVIN